MTPQEKAQEVAKLYLAFAEGKKLQWFSIDENGNNNWITWHENLTQDPPYIVGHNINNWRVKPEAKKIWYRVALFFTETAGFYFYVCQSDDDEYDCKNIGGFIEWKTDRVYVEVKSE